MRKCAVEYVSSVRLHKDTIAFTPWILWIAPCVVDVWIALECFHSFTYKGLLILFINTSPLHFDVFLLMLARVIVAVVDILFGYRLALSMFGSLSEHFRGVFRNAMPEYVYLDIWMTILILSHIAVYSFC